MIFTRSNYTGYLLSRLIIIACLSIAWQHTYAQKRKIEILHSDLLTGDKDVRKLYGNVQFKHQDMKMYCDSAYFFAKDNKFHAYNNVKIVNDDVVITSDTLYYSSNTNLASLRGRITMTNKDVILTTQHLDYNSKLNVGYYYNYGKIVDNENVLTSIQGTYFTDKNILHFKDDVILVNPDYTIYTDTLKYDTHKKIAYFHGPTRIESSENLLYTENGWYDTQHNTAQFFKKSYINNKAQFVYADDLWYDRNKDIGKATKNVLIQDTTEQLWLYGQKGFYDGGKQQVYVTQDLYMIKALQGDSLYLHADSVISQRIEHPTPTDTSYQTIIKAYHKTRFYKSDVQGQCDSLVYDSKDSTIILYTEPILWSDENQMTGNSITLHIINDEISEISIDARAFIVSQDDESTFNQMKGKTLRGYINNNELYKVEVTHNGESIYYMRDDEEIIGINKALCNSIVSYIKDGKVQQIVFKESPSGTLFPPDEILDNNGNLDGFKWLEHKRPIDKNDLRRWE